VSADSGMTKVIETALDTLRLRTESWDKAHYLRIE
jgi:hypothetical protein